MLTKATTTQIYENKKQNVIPWAEKSLKSLGYKVEEILIKKINNSHYIIKEKYTKSVLKVKPTNIIETVTCNRFFRPFKTTVTSVDTKEVMSDAITITKHYRCLDFPNGNVYYKNYM